MSLYTIVKYVHVVLAVTAIGFNISYAIWLQRAAREPKHAAFTLRGLKILDDRFATPAYILLLVTGFVMLFDAGIPVTTFWIAGALALYVAIVVGGIVLYTPALRRQTQLAESGQAGSAEYQEAARRNMMVGTVLVILVLTIEFLMVTKPTLS